MRSTLRDEGHKMIARYKGMPGLEGLSSTQKTVVRKAATNIIDEAYGRVTIKAVCGRRPLCWVLHWHCLCVRMHQCMQIVHARAHGLWYNSRSRGQ